MTSVVFAGKNSDIWQESSRFAVWYFFKVNGRYAGSRSETRKILGENLFNKYSYFSKVEWSFHSSTNGSRQIDKETGLAASNKLLHVVLPILEKKYWPDWEKANK